MKSEPAPAYPAYGAGAPTPYAGNPYAQAHAAAPPPPLDARPVEQQYRSHAAPAFAPAPAPERPQFATFASPNKPVHEDSLPAMPSWSDARDRHVEVEEEPLPQKKGDLEMDRLNHNGSVTNGSMAMAAVGGPRRSPAPPRSPISPMDGYGHNQGFENEPLVGGGPHRSPHASPAPYGRPYAQQDDYRRGSPAQNLLPVYGAGEPYGRHSPSVPPSYHTRDGYGHEPSYDQPGYTQALQAHRTPSPPSANYGAPYDNFAPAPAPVSAPRSLTPGYSPSNAAPAPEPAVSAYPGQRSYTPQASYPGQATYQAFNPGQTSEQFSGVQRKGVDGSYREI
ncbi:hypothetical protein DE146DRAFT_612656 [Phaeosphaeria sp. MPI-PUGE-AT-0046c]|nr:hypothetical protein DE146DRAFT_612656 [Phaeosphaeria sp. MPI-PUGE-AT-0046c]